MGWVGKRGYSRGKRLGSRSKEERNKYHEGGEREKTGKIDKRDDD